ncbi:MAG: hypothetical protein IRZ04_15730 [Rhodospirillales bacterium]|nr:hypothetical protein [Rhodospirillales bacterium]
MDLPVDACTPHYALPGSDRNPGSDSQQQRLWSYCNFLRDDGLSYGDDRRPRPVKVVCEVERVILA